MGPPLQKAYATGQEKIPRGNPPGKRGAGPPEDQQAQKAEVLRNPGGQRLVRPHVRWGYRPLSRGADLSSGIPNTYPQVIRT